MYSRKSVGPRMEPWGTPTLTGYSCEDFPSRTTRSHLLLRKEEIRNVICPGQISPAYRTKTSILILYDTCCGSTTTWYWTSARGSWDFEVIKNLSWQDEFCINQLTQWTFNVPLTFFAFSQHSDWYPSSMDSFSTYWTVIFGNISFAYSANCFGDLMTTLFVSTWE